MKSVNSNLLIFLLSMLSILKAQEENIYYVWPDVPLDQSKVINGTFCEFRNTGSADHFHNAVDISEPDGNPIYACLDGTVYSVVNDGSNSYVSVMSNLNGYWKRLTYLHIVPNPALSVGQTITARESILGTIYQGMGHVHLIEREFVSNPDHSAVEINNIRPNGGLDPFNDNEPPVIYASTINFYSDNSKSLLSSGALYGKIDVSVKVEERNGSTSSGRNNGTFILGYRIWNEDTSEVLYTPNGDGEVYRFDRKPLDSYVHNVFVEGMATLSEPVYWLTNGEGAAAINNSRVVSNNYIDTDLFGEGNYILEIFSEDTRGNTIDLFYDIRFATPPETPVLKAVLNTDRRHSVKIIWEGNAEEDLAGYRLYYSINTQQSTWAMGADESVLKPDMTTYTFNSPEEFREPIESDVYFFFMTAVDSGGAESNPSDIYSRAPHDNGLSYPTVLIVDGFDQYGRIGSWHKPTHNFNTYYFVPLFLSDSLVISSAADDAVVDGKISLTDYDIVVWFAGDDGGPIKSVTPKEQIIIQDYLENGGRLLISGSEIGLDLDTEHIYSTENDTIFYRHYLKSRFVLLGSSSMDRITGKEDGVFEGVTLNIGQTYDENRPDDIDPVNGGEAMLDYNTNRNTGEPRIAGIAYKGTFGNSTEQGGMIYLPFSFETASNMVERTEFMTKALEYFDVVTEVAEESNPAVDEYRLFQNYPNPFNPTTTIEYTIPHGSQLNSHYASNVISRSKTTRNLKNSSTGSAGVRNDKTHVALIVYDILGREVAVLVNETQNPGRYQVEFDASGLSSGLYFYQLTTDTFNKTNKMILLK